MKTRIQRNVARFSSRITVTPTCWIWTGSTLKGYGRYDGTLAHRVSYEMHVGPIPDGLEIDHLCRTPLCVNPGHLEPVTRAENLRRRRDAKTACKNGHPYTQENTRVHRDERRGTTERRCRTCERRNSRRYKAQSR